MYSLNNCKSIWGQTRKLVSKYLGWQPVSHSVPFPCVTVQKAHHAHHLPHQQQDPGLRHRDDQPQGWSLVQHNNWEVTVARKMNGSAVVAQWAAPGAQDCATEAVKGAGVTQHSLPLLPKTTRSVWRVQSRSPLRVNEGNRHWSSFPLPGQCNSSSAGRAVPHWHLLRLGYGGSCSSAAGWTPTWAWV